MIKKEDELLRKEYGYEVYFFLKQSSRRWISETMFISASEI